MRGGVRDGSVVVYTEEINHQPRSIHVLDTATKRVRNVPLVGFLRNPPTLSRDGRLLLLHTLVNGRSEVATVVDTVTGEKLGEIDPPPGYTFFGPALLPNGRGAVAVVGERTRRAVVLYDFAPGAGVAVKPPDPVLPAPPVPPPSGPFAVTPVAPAPAYQQPAELPAPEPVPAHSE